MEAETKKKDGDLKDVKNECKNENKRERNLSGGKEEEKEKEGKKEKKEKEEKEGKMEKEEGKKEGKKEKEGVKDTVMEVAESKVPPPRPPPPKIPHRDSMLGSPTTPLSRANADVIASDEEACHVTSPQDSNMAAMCDKKLSNSCNSADTCCLGRVNCAKTSKCYSAKGKEKQQQQNKQEEEKDKQQQQQNKQEEGKEKQQQQQNKQKEGKDKQQQKGQGKANSNENGSKFYLKVAPAEDFFENVETTQNDGFMKRSKTSLEENLKVDGNKKNKIKMSFSTSFSWKNKLTGVKNALTNIFISPPDELHKGGGRFLKLILLLIKFYLFYKFLNFF